MDTFEEALRQEALPSCVLPQDALRKVAHRPGRHTLDMTSAATIRSQLLQLVDMPLQCPQICKALVPDLDCSQSGRCLVRAARADEPRTNSS